MSYKQIQLYWIDCIDFKRTDTNLIPVSYHCIALSFIIFTMLAYSLSSFVRTYRHGIKGNKIKWSIRMNCLIYLQLANISISSDRLFFSSCFSKHYLDPMLLAAVVSFWKKLLLSDRSSNINLSTSKKRIGNYFLLS